MKRFFQLTVSYWTNFLLAVVVSTMPGCDNEDKAQISHLKAENADLKARVENGSASTQLETENAELKAKLQALIQANQQLQKKMSLASQQQQQASVQQEERSQLPPVTGELRVKLLKLYPFNDDSTYIDFQVTNGSDRFLKHWRIEADLYDLSGQYLGHSAAFGYNLRPEQSVTEKMLFGNIHADTVAKWNPQIKDVSEGSPGGESSDVTANFRLVEVQ
jgi:hypothetical protein